MTTLDDTHSVPAGKSAIPALGRLWLTLEPAAYVILRSVTGAIFAVHGAARLRLVDIGGPTIASTAKFNEMFGLYPGIVWSWYITILELVGGLLLVACLFTRPVALLLVGFLLVGTFYVTPHFGFWARENGFEYSLLFLLIVLYILARGGGPTSIDGCFPREI
jgi:putative oxidoreductase